MTTPSPEYRTITLTQGQVTYVSSEDFEWLSQWKWFASWNSKKGSYYCHRYERRGNRKYGTMPMHRQILGLDYGDKRMGDHVNGNTLDNRRENLRIATSAQNQRNSIKPKTNISGFKGVVERKNRPRRFRAQISVNNKNIDLGSYYTAEEAYAEYCKAAAKYHGEFARLG